MVKAFYGAFNISTNPLVVKLANEGKTLDEIAAAVSSHQMTDVAAERKGNPEALAKAKATREATKEKANAIDEARARAQNDPKIAAMLAELGL